MKNIKYIVNLKALHVPVCSFPLAGYIYHDMCSDTKSKDQPMFIDYADLEDTLWFKIVPYCLEEVKKLKDLYISGCQVTPQEVPLSDTKHYQSGRNAFQTS